jgi:hypothetical protein
MSKLDLLYAQVLHVGFTVLRQAVESGSREWVDAEIELLHNVPSLIGEANKERHRYFWFKERTHYVGWVSAPGRERAGSGMLTFYEPVWSEMEPLIQQLLDRPKSSATGDADRTPD